MNKQFLFVAPILLFLALPLFLSAQSSVLDRTIAVVGKEYILLSDLKAQVEFYAFNNRIDQSTPGLQEQVLEAMVNEKLILVKALEDTTLSVREEDVTVQLDALIAERSRQAGSEKRLEEVYGMPVSRMKREWRDEMRRQLLTQQLWDFKRNGIVATRRETEEFYTAYKDSLPRVPEELDLSHLFRLPKISASARAIVRAKAQKILDSIKAGGDFADFAKRHSDDAGSAPEGGDLGFARRGQFFKEFEEALFALKNQKLADIVETPVGFHIMELVERRGESVHARHILFRIERSPSDADSTKAFLLSLKDSVLHAGMPFAETAKRYSEDKETTPIGGSLGRFALDQLDEALRNVVSSMKDGEISDPLEVAYGTSKGYHIVYLKKRWPEHAMNTQDDWRRVEQMATNFKRNAEYQKWIKQLREEVYWDIRL